MGHFFIGGNWQLHILTAVTDPHWLYTGFTLALHWLYTGFGAVLTGWLAGWMAGWLACWLTGLLAGAGWLAGRKMQANKYRYI